MNEYRKIKRNKYKGKKNKKSISKLSVFFIFTFILGISIGNVCGYSIVSQLKYDIYYLKEDLNEKEILLEQLEADVDKNTSIKEVEKKAKEQLNMDYPKKSQIEYIEIED